MGRPAALVLLVLLAARASEAQQDQLGGIITGTQRLDRGPYSVTNDLVIAEKGQLIIGPGVRLNFYPRTGITVHGILTTQVGQISLNIIIFGVKNNFSFSTIFAFLIYIARDTIVF
jgi:hypothetical protein